MRTISIGNFKGGVGKTTIAISLAAAACLAGARVLIIDADDLKSSTQWMARRSDGSALAGVVVIGCTVPLSLPKFRALSAGYDVVIIDNPPRADRLTMYAAALSDTVLAPFRPGCLDVWAGEDGMKVFNDANDLREANGLPPSRRVIVVNGADVRSRVTAYALDALKDRGEIASYPMRDGATERAPIVIGNRIAFPTATAEGESVITMYPGSPGANEIAALWTCLGGVS